MNYGQLTFLIFLFLFLGVGLGGTPAFAQNEIPECKADSECDDGKFCTGVERCTPGRRVGNFGCVRGTDPCSSRRLSCDEVRDVCFNPLRVDNDGDGHYHPAGGGDDCDDNDRNRFPGNIEVCDFEGHDEDCDKTTFGNRDADGDGFIDARCAN